MSVPFIPTKNATAGVTTAPTTSNLTTAGQMAINAYTGTMYMRKEDSTISDIVGDRLSGFRNRIINGNMAIDQRNAGAVVTTSSGTSGYCVDRFFYENSQASKFTMQQNAGAVTPPTGFSNYLGVVSTSAFSVAAGDYFHVGQRVEGFNTVDLGWGAAGAASVTLSFWARSSLTGTFGGAVRNGAGTRSYPFTYTISATGTWEYKTIVIPGDTTGTWLKDNSTGLQLTFGLGVGATFSGTAGAWAAANYTSATGAVSVVGTNAATLYITGVQLEKGLVPTPFEVRSYGTELALCQRYYIQDNFSATQGVGPVGFADSTTVSLHSYYSKVTMRSAPTFSYTGAFEIRRSGQVASLVSAITQSLSATNMSRLAVISSSLTAGQGVLLEAESGTPTLNFSAEL